MATAAPAVVLSADSAAATTRKGVVVVGVGDAPADATWPVAQAIYGDARLRPKLDDAKARALAGEKVGDDAPVEVKELASLRAQVKGDDAPSRVLLAEIARRTGARALALVFPGADADATEVRLYDAAEDRIESSRYRREKSGWAPLTTPLVARYAPPPAAKPAEKPAPKPAEKPSGGFLSSPWFWGALGAAAAGGLAAYALTRENGASPAVRLEWTRP